MMRPHLHICRFEMVCLHFESSAFLAKLFAICLKGKLCFLQIFERIV